MDKMLVLRGLYVLTDNSLPHTQWALRIEQVIHSGASLIQLRDKTTEDERLLKHAHEVREVCRDYGIPLLVNDRVLLAKKINADGVHLGLHDIHPKAARQYLGRNKIIGVSCYRSILRALQAQSAGADYVAFGSMYPSATKPEAARCPQVVLRKAATQLSIPICAIGGIHARNAKHLLALGADMIAVAQSVFCADEPKRTAAELSRLFSMSQNVN